MKYLLLAIAISFCLFPRCAFGYCGVPEIRPNGEYFKSDVVFTGTVISSRYIDQDVGGWYYRLHVTSVFRGTTQAELSVYTEDSDIRFPLETDRSYLLFAYRRNGRLEIDSCGNSDLLSNAGQSVRVLENLPNAPPFGEIEGWVAPETSGVDVSGVRVTVTGHGRDHIAVTDKDGWFHFRMPIGDYRVDFSSGEYYLNTLDSFRYDPHHFVLHAGETASLQVVSVRHLVP
jgi:Carboxypeptidase regulatory-like domain